MSVYDISVATIDGRVQTLDAYRGRVLLIVNVASRCGFTKQYAGLEELYRKHKDEGFEILGFPCNQFGNQEPGDEAQIQQFCSLTYGVSFPMFAKVQVNGDAAHPLYRHLTSAKRGLLWTRSIKWNFTKFLVGRDGTVLKRFGPLTTPAGLEKHVARAVADGVGQ